MRSEYRRGSVPVPLTLTGLKSVTGLRCGVHFSPWGSDLVLRVTGTVETG